MRAYKILYFTKNKKKFTDFKNKYAQDLKDAQYLGTLVTLLDVFNDKKPKFINTNSLALYLGEYSGILSEIIIIIDTKQVINETGGSTNLRNIIFEYPEIKFLFDEDPKSALFNMYDILDEILKAPIDVCISCLEILGNSLDNHKDKESIIKNIENQREENDSPGPSLVSRIQKKTKHFLSFCKLKKDQTNCEEAKHFLRSIIYTDGENKIEDDIRDVRKQLIYKIAIDYVDFRLITISLEETNSNLFLNIVEGYANLFDASNLRYAIKQWKYANLDVHVQNLRALQESRRDNLAICVEEESAQNWFNSYCLFTNGYRVLPIISAKELMRINEAFDTFNPSIVVRDYDIQFPDQHMVPKNETIDPIDQIRGFRFTEDTREWKVYVNKSTCWSNFYCTNKDSQIGLSKVPILFITKGWRHLCINTDVSQIKCQKGKYVAYRLKNSFCGKSTLILSGIPKPVSGLHCPFFEVKQIKKRYEISRHHKRNYMNIRREQRDHGTSLDIYSMVKSILSRAKNYYKYGEYIYAAVLANEAFEYLNGFHQALMAEAYYIMAIAENAISMDTMGIDEKILSEDAMIRVHKIQEDLKRIYSGTSKKTIINALNQIFSECRSICREKKHINAEEVFIGALGHINEGFFTI